MYPLNSPITDVAIRLRRGYGEAIEYLSGKKIDFETFPDKLDKGTVRLRKAFGERPHVHYIVALNIPRELIPSLNRFGVVLRGYPMPHTEDIRRI